MYIRETVFVHEQGFTEEFDLDDSSALHIIAYSNGIPVGTCRIITRDAEMNSYMIGRVAVLKKYRSYGIGSKLILSAEEHIKCKSVKKATVLIHSQLRVAEFYEKLGYIRTGESDSEQGCPHVMLKKEI